MTLVWRPLGSASQPIPPGYMPRGITPSGREKIGLPIEPWGLSIQGGKALLQGGPSAIMAEATVGKGSVLLFADSQAFMDGLYGNPEYMGYSKVELSTMDKKDYDLKALYDLEYSILEDHLGSKMSALGGDPSDSGTFCRWQRISPL
jgi:hypothetical protein